MRRAGVAAAAGLALLAACTPGSIPGTGPDEVFGSRLDADARRVPGPSYAQIPLWREGRPDQPAVAHTPGGTFEVADTSYLAWTRDGHLLTARYDTGLEVVDVDGVRRGVPLGELALDGVGVTPGSVSALRIDRPLDVEVLGDDLSGRRTVRVPADEVDTDQEGEDAEIHLHGDPLTLDGVTWVEWSVNSEDDTLTDHGVLRVEDGTVVGVQRNEPVVRLYAAYDGAALLALRQDRGDEDCGGCVVAQNLAELDPATGETAAEYGMPPGYDKHWRVDAVDKVGGTVAVRFRVHDGDADDASAQWQLWTYDGEWAEREEYRGARVWFQDGGRLVERPVDPDGSAATSPGEQPATLTWVPGETGSLDGGEVLFEPEPGVCRLAGQEKFCPTLVTDGSLLPAG